MSFFRKCLVVFVVGCVLSACAAAGAEAPSIQRLPSSAPTARQESAMAQQHRASVAALVKYVEARNALIGWGWRTAAAAIAIRTAREAEAARVRVHHKRVHADVSPSYGGRCGGDLPPCYIMMRESRGDIRAENPTSSASGKWQFIDSTWGGYGGYAHASDAPEYVQDERARQVWAGGSGASNWACC